MLRYALFSVLLNKMGDSVTLVCRETGTFYFSDRLVRALALRCSAYGTMIRCRHNVVSVALQGESQHKNG